MRISRLRSMPPVADGITSHTQSGACARERRGGSPFCARSRQRRELAGRRGAARQQQHRPEAEPSGTAQRRHQHEQETDDDDDDERGHEAAAIAAANVPEERTGRRTRRAPTLILGGDLARAGQLVAVCRCGRPRQPGQRCGAAGGGHRPPIGRAAEGTARFQRRDRALRLCLGHSSRIHGIGRPLRGR